MAVPFVIPEGAIPLDQLPPEDQAELQNIPAPVQTPSAVPEGAIPMDELIRTASPEDLFDLTVQSADSDSPFDPKRYLVNNPEIRKDDNLVRKLADADAYVRDRGFELSDIDLGKALGGLWHIGKSFVYDRPKQSISGAASFVKSKTADTEEERSKEKLKWIRGTTESLAAQELAAFDFIGLFNKAGGKVKDLVSSPLTRPPDERLNDFLTRVDDDVQRENISKGKGAAFEAIFGPGVADNLAAAGEAVDPEVVSAVSASDPLVFMAFPGGIKIVHAATGKVLGSAVSKIGAGKIVSTLRRAERAAAQSTAKSEAAAGRVSALEAGPAVADPLIVEATPALERMAQTQAGVARTAAVTAAEEANVSQAVLRSAEEAFNASTPAKLMVGADRLVQPIRQGAEEMISRTIDAGLGVGVGAVGLGATMAEKLGKTIAAFIPPIATPRALRTSYELAGQGGKRLLGVSKELFKGKQSSYSPALTMASDLFATVPLTASGAVRGLLTMDIPFAAVASERPEDTAHMPVIGAFLGGVGRTVPLARQIVRNQRIRARDYGSDAPLRDYRNASGLDAGNKFSVEQGEPGQASRLSALRQMLEPTGAQMYWLSDPKQFADALRRYIPGKTEAWYENASRTKGVADVIIDDAGQPKKVIILNDLEAAEHEAVHPIEKILGKRATDEVFDLIYDEYLPIWEQFGESYARQFTSSEQWQNYLARGEGWREAVLDASQGTTEWRNQLTPDQIHEFGDRYIAGEFLAEAGDAIIKHAGPDIVTSPSFPGKLARILGKVLVGFGVEPFAGVETAGQGIPLRFETTERLAEALKRGVDEAVVDRSRPDVGGVPPYAPRTRPRPPVEPRSGVVPSQPVEPTEPAAAAEEARAIAAEVPETPAARGQRSSKEVLGDVAENIATGEGLKVDYRSAPGEPAGAISSDRTTRRAIIEAFRVMPQSARALFEKLFFPDRVIKTAGGKIQVMGWAPEVFAANAHKLAKALIEKKAASKFMYPIDENTGSFTEQGWRELYEDASIFVKNQKAGQTGAGGPLVVPQSVVERGFTQPARSGEAGGSLDPKRADIISALFGIPIPKTPRITGGRFPRNLAGQEVSEATAPGRVSVPVEPRAPFEGAAAEELGIAGRQIQEVNPFRAALAEKGINPSFIEAIQRLNLESIADVQSAGNAPQFRGVEFTLQAGFLPKPKDPRAIKSAAVRFRNGKIYEGQLHGNALEAGYKAGEMDSSAMEDGFTTNSGEFLSRDAALERAIELKQLSNRKDDGGLESFTFDAGRRFQPRYEIQYSGSGHWHIRDRTTKKTVYDTNLDPVTRILQTGSVARELHARAKLKELEKKAAGDTPPGQSQFQPRLEETVKTIRDADMDQLQELVKNTSGRFGGTLTGFAYDLGAGLKEANQLRTLEDARAFHEGEAKRAMAVKDFDSAAVNGSKAQILRESIEFATGTGPGEAVRARDFPDFEPPLRGQEIPAAGQTQVAESVASEIGASFRPVAAFRTEGVPPEMRAELEALRRETGWEFTPNESSPIAGRTFYTPEGASREVILSRYQEKLSEGGPSTGAKFQPREAKTEAGKKLEKEGFQFANTSDRVDISKDGKTVGSLYYTNFGETAKIHEIWVTDAFRKQGLAEALYREAFTDLKDSGVKEVAGLVIGPIPLKIRNRILPGQTFSRPREAGALDVNTVIPPNAKFQPGERGERFGSELDPERDRGFVGRLSSSGSVRGKWGDLGLLTHEQQGFHTGDRFRYNPEDNTVYWWEMPDDMARDVVSSWVEKQGKPNPAHKSLNDSETNFDAAHGTRFLPDPNKDVEDIAVKYAKDIGLTYAPKLNVLELNPELSKRIADYYQNSKTDPEDAAVKKSYDALINETTAQWKAIEDAGYTMTPSKNEPYKTSKEMLEDVRENRNLSFLKTSPETIKSAANNPMLRPSGVGDLSANDLFRAVHDFFGHAKEGYQFGPKGELNAWRAHSEMFSPEAQGALAAETLAQNSWVNFGPHLRDSAGKIAERGEEGYVAPPDRPFAPQKNIVLPEKLLREVVETLRSVRSDPRREVLPVEPLERLAELQEQTEPDMGGNAQFMPTLAQLEAKWAREERAAASRKPVRKKPTFKMITGVAGGFSKAWLQPDGEPIQLGGMWHHDWMAENAKAVGEQWNITLKQAKSSDADISRKAALEAGFARVNLGLSNGALTVELRAKDLRKHKKSIFDLVEQNSGLVDNITVTLFDDAVRNVLDNASESVFRYDTAEKLEHIPFITTGPEAPASTAGGSKRGPGAIARARALPDAAQFQPNNDSRAIKTAAILIERIGMEPEIVTGPFHAIAFDTAWERGLLREEMDGARTYEGFVTNAGEFLDRDAALQRALEFKQLSPSVVKRIEKEDDVQGYLEADSFDRNRRFQPRRGETEGLPGMEVPREPLTPRARASMSLQDLRKHFPEAVVPRELGDSVPSEIVDSPLFKRAGDEQTAVEQFAKRVVDFAREYESDPAFTAGKKWYSEFTPTLMKQFGKDAQLMAELLAATSPNTSVEVNYGYAFDALTSLRKGRFDKIVPKFEEGLEKIEDASWENWYARELKAGNVKAPPASPTPAAYLAHWIDKHDLKPKQSNGKLYGQHSIPVLQVFARRWLDLNHGPKTKNFVENLMGKSHEATIDVWADRTMRWAGYEGLQDRWRVLPENSTGVSDADFAFSQKVFRAAAEELDMKPSDLQGALWFAEKKRWSDNGWSRLDLGDFRKEIKKNSLLIKGYDQQLRTSQVKDRPSEQMGLDVEPRFK